MKKILFALSIFAASSIFAQLPDALKTDTVLVIKYVELPEYKTKDFASKMANNAIRTNNKNVDKNNEFQEKCLKDYPFPFKYISPFDLQNKEKIGGAKYILQWNVEYEKHSEIGNSGQFGATSSESKDYYIYYVKELATDKNFEIPDFNRGVNQAAGFQQAIKKIKKYFKVD